MRVLLTSDIHGSPDFLAATRQQAATVDARLVIIAGDIGPEYFHSPDLVESQQTFVLTVFSAFAQGLREDGRELVVVLGNHDWACLEPVYQAMHDAGLLVYAHGRCLPLPGAPDWDVIGMNCVTPTRFTRKDHERLDRPGDTVDAHAGHASQSGGPIAFAYVRGAEWLADQPTLADELAALPAPRDWRRTVVVSHGPAAGTRLEVTRSGRKAGSHALRAFIEQHQPRLVVHGHIHEAPVLNGGAFHDRIGSTVLFNAGQQTNARIWHGLWFDLHDPLGTAEHLHHGPATDYTLDG